MRQVLSRPSRLRGEMVPPGDKSISHRALILNAIARGEALVSGLSLGEDVLSTLRCLRQLGVAIDQLDSTGTAIVHGRGERGLEEPGDILDAGNSGTTMRLLSGVLAGQPFLSIVTGDSSLRTRPMDRIIKPLRLMGATILGRGGDSLPPLVIKDGELKGVEYSMPVASAQVKSCLLLAGLSAQGGTVLHQPAPSRDHTERMLQAMGVHLEVDGLTLRLTPGPVTAVDVKVPGDISTAAFWLVVGACHPDARLRLLGVGVNPTRAGILEVLRSMGARITLENQGTESGEPVADITVESSSLHGVEVAGDQIPSMIDELPALAVAACFAEGTTVIKDAAELRVKESDRIRTTVQELSRLGASIEERPDGIVVHGTGRLKGGLCQSHQDHRLAMALGVAGLLADGETLIQEAEAASVSYPAFWEEIGALRSQGKE